MAAATSDLLTGWCLFGLALLAILIFCWVYVRKYQSRRESEVISTITAIFALAVALITSALLPVDIFLVSYMKNPNGTFKVWADANVSRQIEDTVLYGYYTLYSIILFCVFLWIPFVYFYYEEKEEDDGNTCSQVKTALKYTLGFITVCAVLLLIGAFVPLDIPNKKNSTEWEKVKLLFEEFGSSHGLTALSFSISSLTVIGMLAAITYTSFHSTFPTSSDGSWGRALGQLAGDTDLGKYPLEFVGAMQKDFTRLEMWADRNIITFSKGSCKAEEEFMCMCRGTTQEESSSEKDLGVLVDTELTISQECTLAAEKAIDILKCMRNIASYLIGLTNVLIRSNADQDALYPYETVQYKQLNCVNCCEGVGKAYGMSALPLNLIKGTTSASYERLENTEDIEEVEQHLLRIKSKCRDGRPLSSRDRRTLQQLEERLRTLRRRERHLESIEKSWWTKACEAIRPLKIVWGVFFIIVALLFTVSLFLSNLDKALHSAGFDSGFIILGTNLTNPLNMLLPVLQRVFPLDYVLITTIVMYFIFTSMAGIRNMGIWFFWTRSNKTTDGQPQNVTLVSKDCDADAPEDQCIVTRTYLFLHKFWFFSAAYYFGNWAFIAVFLIGLIVSCCKGKKSIIEGEVDDDDSDMSDDELSVYYH
ncbi:hypothetical protein TURU_088810 [Turdus rufiventris]|nr:hypothetical protein TURU_088810 [Turdus rufiventris]